MQHSNIHLKEQFLRQKYELGIHVEANRNKHIILFLTGVIYDTLGRRTKVGLYMSLKLLSSECPYINNTRDWLLQSKIASYVNGSAPIIRTNQNIVPGNDSTMYPLNKITALPMRIIHQNAREKQFS